MVHQTLLLYDNLLPLAEFYAYEGLVVFVLKPMYASCSLYCNHVI